MDGAEAGIFEWEARGASPRPGRTLRPQRLARHVVVLCERAHPEVTQYELIFDVIRDPRFQRNVGYVFTGIGGSLMHPEVEAFLSSGPLGEPEIFEHLRRAFLGMGRSFPWKPASFYDLLRRVHGLNSTLPVERAA